MDFKCYISSSGSSRMDFRARSLAALFFAVRVLSFYVLVSTSANYFTYAFLCLVVLLFDEVHLYLS